MVGLAAVERVLAEEQHVCWDGAVEVAEDPVQVEREQDLRGGDNYTPVFHQQRNFEQLVYFLVDQHVLHGLGDLLSSLGRQPVVGLPGIGDSDLEAGLFGHFEQIVAEELFDHFLALKFKLGIEP